MVKITQSRDTSIRPAISVDPTVSKSGDQMVAKGLASLGQSFVKLGKVAEDNRLYQLKADYEEMENENAIAFLNKDINGEEYSSLRNDFLEGQSEGDRMYLQPHINKFTLRGEQAKYSRMKSDMLGNADIAGQKLEGNYKGDPESFANYRNIVSNLHKNGYITEEERDYRIDTTEQMASFNYLKTRMVSGEDISKDGHFKILNNEQKAKLGQAYGKYISQMNELRIKDISTFHAKKGLTREQSVEEQRAEGLIHIDVTGNENAHNIAQELNGTAPQARSIRNKQLKEEYGEDYGLLKAQLRRNGLTKEISFMAGLNPIGKDDNMVLPYLQYIHEAKKSRTWNEVVSQAKQMDDTLANKTKKLIKDTYESKGNLANFFDSNPLYSPTQKAELLSTVNDIYIAARHGGKTQSEAKAISTNWINSRYNYVNSARGMGSAFGMGTNLFPAMPHKVRIPTSIANPSAQKDAMDSIRDKVITNRNYRTNASVSGDIYEEFLKDSYWVTKNDDSGAVLYMDIPATDGENYVGARAILDREGNPITHDFDPRLGAEDVIAGEIIDNMERILWPNIFKQKPQLPDTPQGKVAKELSGELADVITGSPKARLKSGAKYLYSKTK